VAPPPPAAPSAATEPQRMPITEAAPVGRSGGLSMSRLPARLRPRFRRTTSLWDRRKPSKTFLFYDTQARQVGDLLTLLISEATDVENSESRALNKEAEDSGLLNLTTGTGGDLAASAANVEGEGRGSSNRKFDGSTSFSSDRQFTDRVTITVMDVMPNGNLVVAGARHITVAGDRRVLHVSGIVRPIDIAADNSITSRLVAGLEVKYEGDGVESNFTKQGWLSRLSNKLWPF